MTRAAVDAAAAAISPYVRRTPVVELPGQELGVGAELVVKLEFLQHSGSFKARGATHYVATQPIAAEGVVAASGGNHGAAVAWAARELGHEAHIFVPEIASPAKIERLRGYGAEVHQVGAVYADALAASEEFLAAHPATAIHAYDDPVVMAGAATCARELDGQAPGLDAVLLACGGGGLSGGAAAWYGDGAQIVVVETHGTATYAAAVAAGGPVDVEVSGVAADALGATRVGGTPWNALSAVGATSVLVSDEAVLAARDLLWGLLRVVVEPAAAAPVAALVEGTWRPPTPGTRVGVVLCGANTPIGLP